MDPSAMRNARMTHHSRKGTEFAPGSVWRKTSGNHRTEFRSNEMDSVATSARSVYPTPGVVARPYRARYERMSTAQNTAISGGEWDRRSRNGLTPMAAASLISGPAPLDARRAYIS